jgi:hypothetical protein
MESKGYWADLAKGQADAAANRTPPPAPTPGYQTGYDQGSGKKS